MPRVGPDTEHDETATLLVLLLPQVVAVYVLPAVTGCGAQAAAAVGPVVTVLQLTVVYELPALANCGAQLAAGTGPVELVEQVVAV